MHIMSRAEQIQAEAERVAQIVNDSVTVEEGVPPHQLRGLGHDRFYLKIFSHHKSMYGPRAKEDPEVLIPELGHLSEGQIRSRVEQAADKGLIVKLKDGSGGVSFTTHEAKAHIDAIAREKEAYEEAQEERVERLREKTGLDLKLKRMWSQRVSLVTLEVDLDELEEFVSRVMR